MRITSPVLLAAAVLATAATASVAATTFHGSTSPLVRVSSSGELTIANASGRQGTVRARYVLPSKWRRATALSARTIRFDTRNSCGHEVTFTPRLVETTAATATERALALTPAPSRNVEAQGTREGAAFRVVQPPGTDDLVGVLVQPLPASSSPGTPAGRRLFAEISARATADPRTECHSGGPRTVGDAIGDAFGAGSAGGFAHRAR